MQDQQMMEQLIQRMNTIAENSQRQGELLAVCAQRLETISHDAKDVHKILHEVPGLVALAAKNDQRLSIIEKIVWGVVMTVMAGIVTAIIGLVTK